MLFTLRVGFVLPSVTKIHLKSDQPYKPIGAQKSEPNLPAQSQNNRFKRPSQGIKK